ncbi:MAG: hypothetical protein KF726_27135 [Anaerolineae bacterium]|nr:hypothetical protein [Anaerolineae bacterium]
MITFDDFVTTVFTQSPSAAYHILDDRSLDVIEVIKFYIQLFNAPAFLADKFTIDQLEQGFWTIQSAGYELSVGFLLGDQDIPLELRLACIRAMYILYRDCFAPLTDLGDSVGMWWDSIISGYEMGRDRAIEFSDEHEAIRNAMAETLTLILEDDSLECQGSALHGFGHLCHPQTERVIMVWLEGHPDLDDFTVDYALDAITGDVM